MANVLVTGASGFIGRSLIPALLSMGHNLRCIVSQKVDYPEVEQIVLNRLELQSDWQNLLQGIDVIIHLAARVHIMQEHSPSPLEEYCKVNSIATKRLAEQAAQYGIKRFIFLSSIKVNGEKTVNSFPFTEDSLVQPEDPYAQSKWYAEQYLESISQNTAMELVILRPPLVFGPGVKANFLKMLRLVNKGWPLPFARVNNKRSFVFIDNLVSAINAVLIEPKAANQIYLVADDESWSLTDLISLLAKEMQVRLKLFSVPGILFIFKGLGLSNLSQRLYGSLEVSNYKLKSQLGWIPPVSSAEGLKKTVCWYRDEYKF